MNKKYVIDGSFTLEKMTGIQRMAYETVYALDENANDFDIQLLVPIGVKSKLKILHTIKVVEKGEPTTKRDWYCKYPIKYAILNKRVLINIAEPFPCQYNGIVTIADVRLKEGMFNETTRWKIASDLKMMLATRISKKIITISEFSKERIQSLYHVKPEKLEVIPCAWQHYRNIGLDLKIFEKYPEIVKGGYYYSVGSLAPHKNYKWIYENAKNNPEIQYVVTGGKREVWRAEGFGNLNNIIYTGYITDEEMKALMINSKAFVFPTLYEGFGIPPMEALSVGVKCIVSDIPVMHEIYGDSVSYIDPHKYDISIDQIELVDSSKYAQVLNNYSWENTAKKWLEVLSRM